jgi:hypothetical protein
MRQVESRYLALCDDQYKDVGFFEPYLVDDQCPTGKCILGESGCGG